MHSLSFCPTGSHFYMPMLIHRGPGLLLQCTQRSHGCTHLCRVHIALDDIEDGDVARVLTVTLLGVLRHLPRVCMLCLYVISVSLGRSMQRKKKSVCDTLLSRFFAKHKLPFEPGMELQVGPWLHLAGCGGVLCLMWLECVTVRVNSSPTRAKELR